jgi:hypothetical protein
MRASLRRGAQTRKAAVSCNGYSISSAAARELTMSAPSTSWLPLEKRIERLTTRESDS